MKKRVLYFMTVVVSVLSLQSCVSNYVVSNPVQYKTNAKLATINPKSLNEVKKELTPSKQISAALATLEASSRKAEIEKTIIRDTKIDELLAAADSYLGTPYRYGGMTRNGIDCSAFVLSAYSAAGITLPRVAADQSREGERVEKDQLQKGDLLFFSQGGGRISHVAMVYEVTPEGEVKFIHSASSKGVSYSSLSSSYWSPKFRFAKRIVSDNFAMHATAMN